MKFSSVLAIAFLAIALVVGSAAHAQTSPGTVITNVGRVQFTRPGVIAPETIPTNAVATTVSPASSLSAVSVLRFANTSGATQSSRAGPTQCMSGSGYVDLDPPAFTNGATVDPTQPLGLAQTQMIHSGDAVFLQVMDADQNRDAAAIDYVTLTISSAAGDRETIRLAETAPDSGVFVGYIQSQTSGAATSGDCRLQLDRNSRLVANYTDALDSRDVSNASALVDPYGLVFDSRTGAAVDGARVRLIDVATGASATVFGDDGTSRYPSEMVTGTAVTDAGGTVYTLPEGVFRFPLVAPGQYRLEVSPPRSYSFPSTRSAAELDQVSGAPFRLNDGSFGGAFAATSPPAVAVDVPVDPSGLQLFLTKSTTTTVAAQGDFVQYTLAIENTSTGSVVPDVVVTDTLPSGMRYRTGSTRFNGERTADPEIASDGRTLAFDVGTLAASGRGTLSYVAEITVAAKGDRLTNSARAGNAAGAASNPAQVTIRLRNELFSDKGFITGQVGEGACGADPAQRKGVAGVRVYLEDGRYAVTDDEGKYHFENVAPGSHVVQLDTVSIPNALEALDCGGNVRNAGRAHSQFADLRRGALWRSDFLLLRRPPPKGLFNLALETSTAGPTQLEHTVVLNAAQLPVSNTLIHVVLPKGLTYQAGSARLNSQASDEPAINSDVLSFRIGGVAADVPAKLRFRTAAQPGSTGALAVKAVASFDTPSQSAQRTTPVENVVLRGEMLYEAASYRFTPRFDVLDTAIQASDRAQLDKIVAEWRGVNHLRLTAIGHSDQTLIASRSRAAFTDNYALSHARAESVARYLMERLNIDPARVAIEGRGPDELLSQNHDPASLALNRRVEISIEGLRVVAAGGLTVRTANAVAAPIETTGKLDAGNTIAPSAVARTGLRLDKPDVDVETLKPGVAWVAPAEDDIPAIPSLKIAVQHAPEQTVELRLNGTPVGALNFDGSSTKSDGSVAVSRWRGVDLKDGENELLAIVRGPAGEEALKRTIRYSGGAVRAQIERAQSALTADGSTHPIVALRMFDAAGEPARPGTIGTFSVEPPYRSWWEVRSLQDQQLLALGRREPQFVVDDDGLARIELEPTTQAGQAVLRLRFNERQTQDLRVWLEPQARDWVLVGITEGTAAYRTISANAESAADAGLEEGYSEDGRTAFFAKGRIKGDFLLTLAYDSAREAREKDSLLGIVDPDRYYTLYGDGSEERAETPSSRKLYLKLERRQFMAMFGDFQTGLTVTELSRYSRTLTGLRSQYAGERFGYEAFAADTAQGYVQDEIQGDGTSGLYPLTQRNIIANSDRVRIEVRDRIRTEVVIDTRTLTRFLDYDIDYLNGTLFFKQPISSRDGSFNPQFIIVDYEVESGLDETVSGGGRAYVKLGNTEIGTSFVNQGAPAGDTRLAGLDTRIELGEATTLRAEIARSETDDPNRARSADAYLTEIRHVTERLDATAYYRLQDDDFGFGQQLSTETGASKAGIDARVRLNDLWAVEAEALHQTLISTEAQRELAQVELRRESDRTTAGAGVRHVADRDVSIGDAEAQQAFVNGSVKVFDNRVTLRGEQDISLSGASGVSDFPNRTLVGIDYLLTPDVTLFTDYEHANGADSDSDMTRVGVRATPWARAQLNSSVNQQFSEFGPRTFANFGLTQGWQVNDRLALDFAIDQSRTVRGESDYQFNQNTPRASGTFANGTVTKWQTGDYLALSTSSLYRSALWSITERIEYRDGDSEDRWSLVGGFYREAVSGHAFALVTHYLNTASATSGDAVLADLQLSWAYRPADSRWIVLDRIDLKHERHDSLMQTMESMRIVDNTHLNWQLDARTQVGLQFGARYVRSTFDDETYSGLSGVTGFDLRRDLTQRFDVGVHGTYLSSLDANVSEHSIGVDVGMTPVRNVWVSIGYNFAGFNDDDFSASRYTAQGPYLKFRMKADQDTFKDLSLDGLRPGR